jgi:ABC-type multidrug transport system fused ATPase/permease subunit
LLDKDSSGFFSYYLKAYPAKSALMVALLVLSGLLETVGVAMLFPLMAVVTQPAGGGQVGGFAAHIVNALAIVGIAPTIGKLLLIYVGCIALKSYVMMRAMQQVGFTVAQVGKDLRLELIRAMLQARWGHFANQPIGRLANAIGQEANTSSSAYREACAIFAGAIQILVLICISFAVSWQLTLISIIVGGMLLYGLQRFIETARAAGKHQTVFARTLAGRVVEALQGLKAIKAMGEERQFLAIMESEIEALNESQKHRIMAAEMLKLAQEPLVAILMSAALYFMIALRGMDFGIVAGMTYVFYRLI